MKSFKLVFLFVCLTFPKEIWAQYTPEDSLHRKADSFMPAQLKCSDEEIAIMKSYDNYSEEKIKGNPDSALYYYRLYLKRFHHASMVPYIYYDMASLYDLKNQSRRAKKYLEKIFRFKSTVNLKRYNQEKDYWADTLITTKYKARKLLIEILLQEKNYKQLSKEFPLLEKEFSEVTRASCGTMRSKERYFINTSKAVYYEKVDSIDKALEVLSEERINDLFSFNKIVELLIKKYGITTTKIAFEKALQNARGGYIQMTIPIDLLKNKIVIHGNLTRCENNKSGLEEMQKRIDCLKNNTILKEIFK